MERIKEALDNYEKSNRELANQLKISWECDVEEIHLGMYDFDDVILTDTDVFICLSLGATRNQVLEYKDGFMDRHKIGKPQNLKNYILYGWIDGE